MLRAVAAIALIVVVGVLTSAPAFAAKAIRQSDKAGARSAQSAAPSPEERGFNIPDESTPARKKPAPAPPTTPSDSETAESRSASPAPIISPRRLQSAARPVAARPAPAGLPETGFDALSLVWLGALALFAGLCIRYAVRLDEQLDAARASGALTRGVSPGCSRPGPPPGPRS